MSDIPEHDTEHTVAEEADEYKAIQLSPHWFLLVHEEGELALEFRPDPKDPKKNFGFDLGYTEMHPKIIQQMINVIRTGDDRVTTIH